MVLTDCFSRRQIVFFVGCWLEMEAWLHNERVIKHDASHCKSRSEVLGLATGVNRSYIHGVRIMKTTALHTDNNIFKLMQTIISWTPV